MKLDQHNGIWYATYQGEEYNTGQSDIMDAINSATAHFDFGTEKALS